jgi:hypothetical protein
MKKPQELNRTVATNQSISQYKSKNLKNKKIKK